MPHTTQKEGVVTVHDDANELVAIIYKDMKTRKNIFYATQEMSTEELERLIGCDEVKPA